jgi:hypothetical protein
MAVCSALTPLLYAMLLVCAPAALPLAAVLDAALGRRGLDTLFGRQELRAVIALHAHEGARLDGCRNSCSWQGA